MKSNDLGISPTTGIILVLAITIAISLVVSTVALDLGDTTNESVQAGVDIQQQGDGYYQIQWQKEGNAEELQVLVNGSEVDNATLSSPGDSVTIGVSEGDTISVSGTSGDSTSQISSTTATSGSISSPTVSSTPETTLSNSTSSDTYSGGNTVTVDYEVTNESDTEKDMTITLDVSDGIGKVDSVTETAVSSGETRTGSLTWDVPSDQTEGDYTLTVSGGGETSTTTVSVETSINPAITVSDSNRDDTTLTFSVDSNLSTSNIQSVNWEFGDSSTGSGQPVTHTYSSTGQYNVTVTVTADDGDSSSTTKQISAGREDFYDGIESGTLGDSWTVTGLNGQVSSNRSFEGSNSLYLDSGYNYYGNIYRDIPITDASGPYTFWVYQESDPYDDVRFRFKGTDNYTLFKINFNRETTQNVHINNNEKSTGFPTDVWTRVSVKNVDFDNGTYDWEIVTSYGSTVASGSSTFNSDRIDYVQGFRMDASGGDSHKYYVDSIEAAGSVVPLTSEFSKTGGSGKYSLSFDASDSYGGQSISSYEWEFGDGSTGSGETVTHTYSSSGQQDVTLTVTDSNGVSESTTKTVNVPVFYDGFENGLTGWTVHNSNFTQQSNPVYKGSSSVGMSSGSFTETKMAEKTIYENGGTPDNLTYYYYETRDSYGGGIRVKNSDGQYEMGTATDNPQFSVSSGDSIGRVDSGSDYQHWVRVEVTFDWSNDQFTYKFTDLNTGRTKQGTQSLRHGKDLSSITIEDYSNDTWGHGGSFYMWFDEISVE